MLGVGVGEEQHVALRRPVALDQCPLFPEPPGGQLFTAHQPQPPACGRLDDVGRAVGRAVVDDNHLDRRVARREYCFQTALDVTRFIARGDDDRDERAGAEWLVGAQLGATHEIAIVDEAQDGEPRQCQQRHCRVSTAATTTAPPTWPVTFVIVRNMSGMRSRPIRMLRPEIGSPVVANAGSRLMTLAAGTLATVRDARNTAAPAWSSCPAPNGMPYSRAMKSTAIV